MYYYTRLARAAQAAHSAGFALELIIRCFFARFFIGDFQWRAGERFGSVSGTGIRGMGDCWMIWRNTDPKPGTGRRKSKPGQG
jgi:hypothetical protein